MSKDKISDYSATANSNTDIAGINIDEGCAPSGINNAIRTLMKQLKDFQQGTNSDSFNGPTNGAHNGTVGATTPAAGTFTTLSASGVTTLSAGSASAPALTTSGDTNTGVLFPAADTVAITTGGTERARVDSSGNLGLGVTPSAWGSSNTAFQIGNGAIWKSGSRSVDFIANGYYNGTNYIYNTTNAATYYRQIDGQHQWYNAASGTAGNAITFTQAMTLDASGNLVVGATSAISSGKVSLSTDLATYNGVVVKDTATSYAGTNMFYFGLNSSGSAVGGLTHPGVQDIGVWGYSNVILSTGSSGTERARIDSSGNLLVGTTTAGAKVRIETNLAPQDGLDIKNTTNNTGNTFVAFINYNNVTAGTITQPTATTVAYNTSSDYRLKENVQPMVGALDKVAALKPCTYKWKDEFGGSNGQGFIAHELQEVVPDCVSGEKDAVDTDGNPVYQGIDTSFLVATLTAAIQEQQAIITTLTERITALEAPKV